MLNMIAAALVAAQPAATPAPNAHSQHEQMGHQPGAKPGMMAGMKDCCCKDMMGKTDGEHACHQAHSGEHQNHQQ